MGRQPDVISLQTNSGNDEPCAIVIDPRTQRFLERAEDNSLLTKPTNCVGDEYSLCHLSLAALLEPLARIFPDIDVWDDPDDLIAALDDFALSQQTTVQQAEVDQLKVDVASLKSTVNQITPANTLAAILADPAACDQLAAALVAK